MKPAILITAGTPREKLDNELGIINYRHADTGHLFANYLLEHHYADISYIYFVATPNAVQPMLGSDKLKIYETTDAASVWQTVQDLNKTYRIDTVIHAARTDSYKTSYVVQTDYLAEQLWRKAKDNSVTTLDEFINLLKDPKDTYDLNLGMAPNTPDFIMRLEPVPDILKGLRGLFPTAKIIGTTQTHAYDTTVMNRAGAELRENAGADYIIVRHVGRNYPNETQSLVIGARNMRRPCANNAELKEVIANIVLNKE